jgi:outer membrane immunogenic protein
MPVLLNHSGAIVRKLFIGSLAVVASAIGNAAYAADMPLKAPVPVPFVSWTGCYVGGNVGYGLSLDESIAFTGTFQDGFFVNNQFPRSIPINPKGVVGGGQTGCNAQVAQWVFGVETDFQGSNISVSNGMSPIPNAGAQFTTTATESRDWFGTLRARAGLLALPQALLYATGGLAYGETSLSFSTQAVAAPGVACSPVFPCATASASGTSIGFTVGAGMEWMFAPNWTVKAEYLYLDLGKRTISGPTVPTTVPPGVFAAGVDFREHIARVGVNYLFNLGWLAGAY